MSSDRIAKSPSPNTAIPNDNDDQGVEVTGIPPNHTGSSSSLSSSAFSQRLNTTESSASRQRSQQQQQQQSSGTNGKPVTQDLASSINFNTSFDLLDYKSVTLENKGSVARDHMANERTFLAWLRTSLAFITIGIGVTQLFRLEKPGTKVHTTDRIIDLSMDHKSGDLKRYGKPLGSIFIVLGILTLIMGFKRYFHVQRLLTKSYYPAARLGIAILLFLILSVVLVTLALVLQTSLL
ncbi:hypothetical protein CORT_0D02610 [Candida orthopsilosis Co 90-125]|uniref:DUF202 domain-containing protein n=1 Tax=Candida orthopsilosis (strain 90-125) TaxID=1136231 RepID=H8X513_CANO9|nr:hypothetical protein CORT_0D02610 [Candida orthopsilosis Co 90-125]CCG23106.1 hypothetical protein CORT_0D02610 [Candida orthopsilosis Co 90-125]